ncbi:MAG: VCBS repeat-containing protein, partial [Candidatus Zixiibacteriota bacterium]
MMRISLKTAVLSLAAVVIAALICGLALAQVPEKAPVPPKQEIYHPPRTGFIPPPIDLSHLKAQEIPDELKHIQPPARWDWREHGIITPVQNQGNCGSCYAFASLANIESKLLIDGAGSYDFSENNVKECEWYESSCDGGWYSAMASWLAKTGTVLETDDPYVAADVACNSTCPYVTTLLDWRIISGATLPATAALKSYIFNHGPVFSTLFVGDTTPAHLAWMNEYQNYNGLYTLYYPPDGPSNHAILIVGWDDALPHAGGTGAWIVKNSWGTGWGGTCGHGAESGYFTIAYGSAAMGKWSSYMYDWQNYDDNGQVHHYDEGGSSAYRGYGSVTAWGLCGFVPSSATYLRRVEFWTNDITTDIDVYIYDDFDYVFLRNLLASELNNSFSEAGYHSVAIDPPLSLSAGDDIFAVVKFTNATYQWPLPVDSAGPNEAFKTFVSPNGGDGSWYDLGYFDGEDVAIRIRTSTTLPAGPEVVSVTPTQNELDVPVTTDIEVIFDKDIHPASVSPNTFVAEGSLSGKLPGTITCSVVGATFDPDENFKPGEVITVTLTTGIQSMAGDPMDSSYVWSFTVASGAGGSDFTLDAAYNVADKPLSVFAADLDGDGDIDLATADGDSWGEPGTTVSVLLNNGDGTYAPFSSYPTGSYPLSISGADLDGDGDMDLVTTNYFTMDVSILLNNGNGTFAAHTDYSISTSPYSVVGADLDGDGDLDLATANAEAPFVSVLMNNGNGTFAANVNYSVNNFPISIVAGDLDGDGDLDLATADIGPIHVPDSTVSVQNRD